MLVTGVPREYLDRNAILRLTSRLPGGIRQMWISRALGDLPDLYDKRLNATKKLESAETALCKTAIKLKAASDKKQAKQQRKRTSSANTADASLIDRNADHAVPADKRPHHRLGFMGFFGQRVDTIDHCKKEIVNLTKQLTDHRAKVDEHPPHNSVFIEFEEQMAAHLFAQAVVHHAPLAMSSKYVDVAPEDVIYSNLKWVQLSLPVASWLIPLRAASVPTTCGCAAASCGSSRSSSSSSGPVRPWLIPILPRLTSGPSPGRLHRHRLEPLVTLHQGLLAGVDVQAPEPCPGRYPGPSTR